MAYVLHGSIYIYNWGLLISFTLLLISDEYAHSFFFSFPEGDILIGPSPIIFGT
jgi:hypothetical protein